MPDGSLWAVVPVKSLWRAKQRLAPVLAPEERSGLARAMLEDVLSALTAAAGLAGVVVVTGDAEAVGIARAAGAQIAADPEEQGHSAAVAAAVRFLAGTGAGILTIPADVPLVTAAEVEAVLAVHGRAPAVTIVPALADGGSNAMACSPPGVIPFHFGQDSFRRHRQAARSDGIEPRVVSLPGLGRDIDRPQDLLAVIARPSPTRAHAFLEDSGIAARLMAMEET